MIFQVLNDAAKAGELLLVDGGMCHFHIRMDGQLTIREIIVLPDRRSQGVGVNLLQQLARRPGVRSIFAKCPVELAANGWYERVGFIEGDRERTRTGRELRTWRLTLSTAAAGTPASAT